MRRKSNVCYSFVLWQLLWMCISFYCYLYIIVWLAYWKVAHTMWAHRKTHQHRVTLDRTHITNNNIAAAVAAVVVVAEERKRSDKELAATTAQPHIRTLRGRVSHVVNQYTGEKRSSRIMKVNSNFANRARHSTSVIV